MPRLIDCPTAETIELGDLVEALETRGLDARDEDGFAAWGSALRKLANNRRFLADLIIAELKERCAGQVRSNQYSAQVILLHAAAKGFIIRANIWPAAGGSVVRQSGTNPFFYGVPHDHNFSFLTVGYLGPGYWSDYYEYEYDRVRGYPGEKVELRFAGRSRLDQGKVMLYRAHRDVHLQLPADAMSVSINIVEAGHSAHFRDQYRFDLDRGEIAGIMNPNSLDPMFALAAHLGGGEGADLLDHVSARHPSERVRAMALTARAGAASTLDARIEIFERAARSDSGLVRATARREADKLAAGRSWIEPRDR